MSAEKETTYYNGDQALVTSTRVRLGGRTFATAHIASVEVVEKPARRTVWVLMAVAGLGVGILGATQGNEAICMGIGALALVAGVVGTWVSRKLFVVTLLTGGSQVPAYALPRSDVAEGIAAAITKAITG